MHFSVNLDIKANELVVGNVHGDLFIYKGEDSKPWLTSSGLGMTTCLEIGDVCNHKMNYLITLSAEGWCNIFNIKGGPTSQLVDTGDENAEEVRQLRPNYKRHLAANSKVILIADIDGDGLNELVIGYTDRRVRAYRWKEGGDTVANVASLNGQFVLVEDWQLAGQIGSLSVNTRPDGWQDIMVSQPGGTFVTLLGLNPECTRSRHDSKKYDGEETESNTSEPYLMYHPLGSARARNPGVTTEIVGSISRRKRGEESSVPNFSAICTLDGTLTLVDDDKILWSVYVDHQLFSLAKLDITGDGTEEVVACSWDGQTYMLNLDKDVVRFHFRENVAAFCAGYYGMGSGNDVPCLIYATFNNRLIVYHNIEMYRIASTNLLKSMDREGEVLDLMNVLNCDASNPAQVRQFYKWCLYGYHPKDK
ncbi:hypothetical protein CAPTEDRAFT_227809 [Capitella teleta]|uniref:Integrin alpha FG-GAP repeat containing 2 n=1 Tax=Capitella teleta TaxID=283909 RepID=R7VJ94_CAPTE|nr:hypothetical protein CAPTEDRAFT_227809 [Capitella teleta]|eukprot:ELU16416.1 hypothetical protein CAPTEDRAFT_227809 [Capitella teleta]